MHSLPRAIRLGFIGFLLLIQNLQANDLPLIDGTSYALWKVQARLDGVALAPVSWVGRKGHPAGLQIGQVGTPQSWAIKLWSGGEKEGELQLMRHITQGEPPQDLSASSSAVMQDGILIVKAHNADASSELELRAEVIRIVPDGPVTQHPAVAPVYPPDALAQGIEGVVMLSVDIDAAGDVLAVRVEKSTPPGVFDMSALTAAAFWKFNPSHDAQGKAIASTVRTPVGFKIEETKKKRKPRRPIKR